ncbi:MAG: hypothetical protein PHI81_01420, partial [Synergistaceae bacterium]|nr:hypothetical protein [Synergistaceae bacterium]
MHDTETSFMVLCINGRGAANSLSAAPGPGMRDGFGGNDRMKGSGTVKSRVNLLLITAVVICAAFFSPLPLFAVGVQAKTAGKPSGDNGLYVVTAKELPLFEKPVAKVPRVEYPGDLPNFYGIVVYGNHVELRPIKDNK